jgi:hypothetical protein
MEGPIVSGAWNWCLMMVIVVMMVMIEAVYKYRH